MYSSLIGKVEKARRYAQERDRVGISQLTASFRGEHNTYIVSYQAGQWSCNCPFFDSHGVCSHTMALERILEGMVPVQSAPFATV